MKPTDVIRRPLVTEKTTILREDGRTLVLQVAADANKVQIRRAVETLFGRRRYIPDIRDRNFNIRAFAERTSQNTPLQGSAADLIKRAMIAVHRRLRTERLEARLLLQVHDELVLEAPPEEIERVVALVREEMEGAAELNVPLVVGIGTGKNWLDAK